MPQSKIDRRYYQLRGHHADYRQREWTALRWLKRRIDATCYVSWSAGKDSMVAAHLAQRLQPGIQMLMVDPGVPVHWTESDRSLMLDFAASDGWNVRLVPWDKFGVATPDDQRAYRDSIHARMFGDLTAYADGAGLSCRITGMRAAESRNRARLLRSRRGETAHTLQPIWDWTTDDVWTYTISHELPWLSIYDHLGPAARNGLIGKNGTEQGRMVYLRKYYPEAFRMACELIEGRSYV